jgi:hypothetical protein
VFGAVAVASLKPAACVILPSPTVSKLVTFGTVAAAESASKLLSAICYPARAANPAVVCTGAMERVRDRGWGMGGGRYRHFI